MGQHIDFNNINLVRIGHNFLNKDKVNYSIDDLNRQTNFLSFLFDEKNRDLPKYKVGLMFVCINNPYWQYIQPVVEGAKTFFLPGHETEIMVWSDVPKPSSPEAETLLSGVPAYADLVNDPQKDRKITKEYISHHINTVAGLQGLTVFPTESVTWPYPTLMRYHLFLQQEEYLQKFDYLFYLDLDMRIVGVVGDEILGDGLTMAQHPMYALRPEFWLPYEPNPTSAAHIKQPGRIVEHNGKKVFQPLYAAGGMQGGTKDSFMKAMKEMKKSIDQDFGRNYIARWNDESHWNRYLYDNPPAVVLNPSYVYPDSLINEYYKKLWGCDYPPKIITLTKPFTLSQEGGAAAKNLTETL